MFSFHTLKILRLMQKTIICTTHPTLLLQGVKRKQVGFRSLLSFVLSLYISIRKGEKKKMRRPLQYLLFPSEEQYQRKVYSECHGHGHDNPYGDPGGSDVSLQYPPAEVRRMERRK